MEDNPSPTCTNSQMAADPVQSLSIVKKMILLKSIINMNIRLPTRNNENMCLDQLNSHINQKQTPFGHTP